MMMKIFMETKTMKHNREREEESEDTILAQDFYHNKQNRALKRQQKYLRKKDHDSEDYDRDYD